MNTGKELIMAERQRQIDIEGWSVEHDDEHGPQILESAAKSYRDAEGPRSIMPKQWPWAEDWWKPKSRQRNLERSGALYLAAAEAAERAKDCEARDHLKEQARSCEVLLDSVLS